MGPAVKTRLPQNLDDEDEVQSRFTVIVPEAASKFPTHCMNLAQHLNYSCEAMTRLKMLTQGTQELGSNFYYKGFGLISVGFVSHIGINNSRRCLS